MTTLADEWLEIGTIVGAYGIQGEVKVLSLSDFPERF
ncbi:MAG: ribosome maturation factor RimM, partial [Microcystaceae cyanobacterium]